MSPSLPAQHLGNDIWWQRHHRYQQWRRRQWWQQQQRRGSKHPQPHFYPSFTVVMATGPVQPPSASRRCPLYGEQLWQPGRTLPVPRAPPTAAGRQGWSHLQRGSCRQSWGGHWPGQHLHGGQWIHERWRRAEQERYAHWWCQQWVSGLHWWRFSNLTERFLL